MITGRLAETRILLVDDEQDALDTEALVLRVNGFTDVRTCADSRHVLDMLTEEAAGLVVLDITMPHVSGHEVLRLIRQQWPGTAVIMLTGLNDAATAVDCLKAGAYDYIVKPVDQARLVTTVTNAVERQAIETEAEELGRRLLEGSVRDPAVFTGIVTRDPRMHGIFAYVEAIAPTDLPGPITGETGVGKELIAGAIHRASRRGGQFVSVNSAGIDDALFSDTLFGHAAGAFTGAQKDRRGLIERAADGTLFLDEVGDLRPETQVKLLRLLQERVYYRLGSEIEERSTARVVAATNRDLRDLQTDPVFRKDLFYRLKSHHIHVPALRERPEDIPLLADALLSMAATQQGKPIPAVPPEFFTDPLQPLVPRQRPGAPGPDLRCSESAYQRCALVRANQGGDWLRGGPGGRDGTCRHRLLPSDVADGRPTGAGTGPRSARARRRQQETGGGDDRDGAADVPDQTLETGDTVRLSFARPHHSRGWPHTPGGGVRRARSSSSCGPPPVDPTWASHCHDVDPPEATRSPTTGQPQAPRAADDSINATGP